MQVLGDLVCIPANREPALPLPWWHRAPLGLTHNTLVYVALTAVSTDRPVGDLFVTVLDPNHWDRMFRLECSQEDRPGLVAQVFDTVKPLNIALAETVKVEKDGLHHLSLICEPVSDEQEVKVEVERIKSALKNGGFNVNEPQPLPPLPTIVWHRAGEVEHGWIKGVDWKSEMRKQYKSSLDQVDLNRVVVSADTESRVLRYVFPRRGAMTVRIRHADMPGALAEITHALQSCELNILSALLRRGGGRGADAELVAVCEPSKSAGEEEVSRLQENVRHIVSRINQKFRPQPSVNRGMDADETIYSRHPDEMVARVPGNLSWAVQAEKRRIRDKLVIEKRIPIFLSRRFPQPDDEAARVVEDVRRALEDAQCFAIEAEPTFARDPNTIYTDVSSKMWVCRAGIVLVVKETADKDPLSLNLAHEWGFLLGQGKAVLALVEEEEKCWNMIKSFTNLAGVSVQGFDRKASRSSRKSVNSIIENWVRFFKETANIDPFRGSTMG